MKHLILIIFLTFTYNQTFAQEEGPKELTTQKLQKIRADIEKHIPDLKQSLSDLDFSSRQIEFAIDTFRIERLAAERMNIDYSTSGMNLAINELTDSYDKLLNKYYNKLIKLLDPEDKKVLLNAQKAWLVFRDSERIFISTMIKEKYSGGGTIQSNIAADNYSQIVIHRTIDIFNYFNSIDKNE